MLSPTLRDRTQALDVMRGFAVLGILIANISSFATRNLGQSQAGHGRYTGLDLWLDAFATVLVTGKMRSILAILFGVGIWLQYQKRAKIAGNWPWGYLRRSLCLAVIGIFHGLFLWFGDILLFYAVMSVLTVLLVKADARILQAIIGVGFGIGFFAGMVSVALLSANPAMGDSSFAAFTGAFEHGTYLDQFRARTTLYPVVFAMLCLQGVAMLPLFLLGVLFGRSGTLSHPSKHPRTRNFALAVGFGIGVPLNLLGLQKLRGYEFISVLMEFSAGPILAIGLLMGGAMIVERGVLVGVTQTFAKVGRLALTTYVSQSILASLVFYSWGLGLIGSVSFAQQLLIVGAIWSVNILFAHLWLRRYPLGPAEWLLRSLTEGRRLKIDLVPGTDVRHGQ